MVATPALPVPVDYDLERAQAKQLHRRQLLAQQPQGEASAHVFGSTRAASAAWEADQEDDGLLFRLDDLQSELQAAGDTDRRQSAVTSMFRRAVFVPFGSLSAAAVGIGEVEVLQESVTQDKSVRMKVNGLVDEFLLDHADALMMTAGQPLAATGIATALGSSHSSGSFYTEGGSPTSSDDDSRHTGRRDHHAQQVAPSGDFSLPALVRRLQAAGLAARLEQPGRQPATGARKQAWGTVAPYIVVADHNPAGASAGRGHKITDDDPDYDVITGNGRQGFTTGRQLLAHSPLDDLVVELHLRDYLCIAPASGPFLAVMRERCPAVFVGRRKELLDLVSSMAAAVAACFAAQGLALPPWRSHDALVRRWLPAATRTGESAAAPDALLQGRKASTAALGKAFPTVVGFNVTAASATAPSEAITDGPSTEAEEADAHTAAGSAAAEIGRSIPKIVHTEKGEVMLAALDMAAAELRPSTRLAGSSAGSDSAALADSSDDDNSDNAAEALAALSKAMLGDSNVDDDGGLLGWLPKYAPAAEPVTAGGGIGRIGNTEITAPPPPFSFRSAVTGSLSFAFRSSFGIAAVADGGGGGGGGSFRTLSAEAEDAEHGARWGAFDFAILRSLSSAH